MFSGLGLAGHRLFGFVAEPPIWSRFYFAVFKRQGVRGRKFIDAFIDRKWRGHVIEREIMAQGLEIERTLDGGVGQQNFGLRSKQQSLFKDAPVQRLFAETI